MIDKQWENPHSADFSKSIADYLYASDTLGWLPVYQGTQMQDSPRRIGSVFHLTPEQCSL